MVTFTKFFAFFSPFMILMNPKSINDNQLIYLNKPETLTNTGILHKRKYTKNSNVRYFFHYKNGTSNNQKFSIKTNNFVKNLKISYDISNKPDLAGCRAIKKFMLTIPYDSRLDYSINLNSKYTISGLIEGEITQNDEILFQFGSGKKIIGVDKIQDNYNLNFNISVDNKSESKFRLGDPVKNAVDGQYGSNVILNVTPNNTGIMKLAFSPRGGHGMLIFEKDGNIYNTDIRPVYEKFTVMYIAVEKGKPEVLRFIPIGGFNYPIELTFSIHDQILKEAHT